MTKRTQMIARLILLSILLAGCASAVPQTEAPPTETSSTDSSTSTLPAGWETYSASTVQGQCGYAIDHPSDMDGANQSEYNWLLNYSSTESSGPVPNFIYISVIPDDFQSDEPGLIYNYDPVATQTLLNMQVGESRSLHENVALASGFTYSRLPDTTLGDQAVKKYENVQPWEFPPGTKEIRYYMQANGCTYLIGGYMSTVGSGQPGAIDEASFDQIIATFRPAL